MAAGAGDALPFAGAVLVPAVQGAMLHKLAKLHGVQWQRRDYAEFAGALGAGTLIRTASTFGIRQLVKLIPVYGQTAGAAAAAAASFAATYALGKAASFFLARRRQGVTDRGGFARVSRGAAGRLPTGQGARHRGHREGSQGVVSKPVKPAGIPRMVLLAVALVLPAASLIPLGSLWLWEHGYILYWALFSCIVVSGIYYLQRRLMTGPPAAALPDRGRGRCAGRYPLVAQAG